ncbi:unnamed protein product [Larinioides sclopetarius]|uniref:Uncharacterized protein n=1 Tax=Larinioides sclopetarius TaxID=280406 RepID=A0AAV2AU59_9ARAC
METNTSSDMHAYKWIFKVTRTPLQTLSMCHTPKNVVSVITRKEEKYEESYTLVSDPLGEWCGSNNLGSFKQRRFKVSQTQQAVGRKKSEYWYFTASQLPQLYQLIFPVNVFLAQETDSSQVP